MQEVLGGVVGAYPGRQSHEKLPGVLVQVVEFRSQLCAVRLMEESHSFMSVNYRTCGTSDTLHKITSKRGNLSTKDKRLGPKCVHYVLHYIYKDVMLSHMHTHTHTHAHMMSCTHTHVHIFFIP